MLFSCSFKLFWHVHEVMYFVFTVSFGIKQKDLSCRGRAEAIKIKVKNILLVLFPCFCIVDLLIVFLVQGQRQVSSFWSSPGLAVCVCVLLGCFEALSVIQSCLVYQSYMSHTTVIWSGAVSTRRCYSCSTNSPARWKKRVVIDWLIDRDKSLRYCLM